MNEKKEEKKKNRVKEKEREKFEMAVSQTISFFVETKTHESVSPRETRI